MKGLVDWLDGIAPPAVVPPLRPASLSGQLVTQCRSICRHIRAIVYPAGLYYYRPVPLIRTLQTRRLASQRVPVLPRHEERSTNMSSSLSFLQSSPPCSSRSPSSEAHAYQPRAHGPAAEAEALPSCTAPHWLVAWRGE